MNSSINNWHPVRVPHICERMIGFSVPIDRQVLLVTYDGLKLLNLNKPLVVRDVHEPHEWYEHFEVSFIYNDQKTTVDAEGKTWTMLGLHPGTPIIERPNGELLNMDESNNQIFISSNGSTTWLDSYENFSGDWVAATFSDDDWYIVLGCPYGFDFKVWERTPNS